VAFNETLAFLQDQLTAVKAQGLSGQDAIDFIATAECESTPPRDVTPDLEAWIKMNHEPISAYDRICDNTSARFCAANPDNILCTEQELEEEEQEVAQEERTFEVIAIVEAVVIVILIFVSVIACVKQQGVVHVDDVGYVQMDNKI